MDATQFKTLLLGAAAASVAKAIMANMNGMMADAGSMALISNALDEAFRAGVQWQACQPSEKARKAVEMKPGRIYFIQYSGNTQVVGRFKKGDATNYYFTSLLHNWNGNQSFRHENGHPPYTVHSGIELIREASLSEKQSLMKHELDNNAC